MRDKILEEFKTKKTTLNSFKERSVNLLVDLLRENNIIFHQISARTKDFESLSKKIDKKQGKYNSLNEITDLVGIRIITYLESEVDLVSELIKKEFKEDELNSIDKRILKTDQFGYKSLHIVCSLNDSRSKLSEYSSYKELKCEIQIRSILQHAWAEIEHDLGYKGKSSIPDEYKRDFNRLAALLETADKGFDRLKKELLEYEKNVPKLIKNQPENVELNQASLQSILSTNEILINSREIIIKNTGAEIYDNKDLDNLISKFMFFNIDNVKQLEDILKTNEKEYLSFVNEYTKKMRYSKLPISLPVFYFQHFLASMTQSTDVVEKYFNYGDGSISHDSKTAVNFIKIYQNAIKITE